MVTMTGLMYTLTQGHLGSVNDVVWWFLPKTCFKEHLHRTKMPGNGYEVPTAFSVAVDISAVLRF